MPYGTLMVYMGLGRSNNELLRVAGDLAIRCRAGVIGVAAREPARVGAGEGFVFWNIFSIAPDALCSEIENAEAEFRTALQRRVADLEWRSAAMCASIADYLAHEARSADVLIIDIAADVFNSSRRVNACDFVMQLGRPVIIVPATEAMATFDTAPRKTSPQVIGWVG
jgi:hypothetical protein